MLRSVHTRIASAMAAVLAGALLLAGCAFGPMTVLLQSSGDRKACVK